MGIETFIMIAVASDLILILVWFGIVSLNNHDVLGHQIHRLRGRFSGHLDQCSDFISPSKRYDLSSSKGGQYVFL